MSFAPRTTRRPIFPKAKAVACEAGHLPDDVAYREKARYHLNLFVW